MWRKYKEPAEERANPSRVRGIVKYDGLETWFVQNEKDGKYYWFNNYIEHNPFRGIGSLQSTYFIGIDDPEKKMPYRSVKDMYDNCTNPKRVGNIFYENAFVTFVPKRPHELLCSHGDTVIMHVHDCHKFNTYDFQVPEGCVGLACDVALNTDKDIPPDNNRQARDFAPSLPPLI